MHTDTNAQTVEQTAIIHAPVTEICSVLSVLPKISEYWPDKMSGNVYDTPCEPDSGAVDGESSVGSLDIDPQVETVSTPTAVTMSLERDLEGTIRWHLTETDDCTHVSATIAVTHVLEDDLPPDWTDGEPTAAVRETLPDTLSAVLQNLKQRCERSSPPTRTASQFETPALSIPAGTESSPHREAVTAHTRRWVREWGIETLVDSPEAIAQVARLVCLSHPNAPRPALELCSDWTVWLFAFDDCLDRTDHGTDPSAIERFQRPFRAVLGDEPPRSDGQPLVQAFADVYQRARDRMPPVWQDRWAKQHRTYFDGARWEVTTRCAGQIPTREAYVEHRRSAAAMDAVLAFVEMTHDCVIPAAVFRCPAFAALRKNAGNVIAWTNDLYSLQREMAHGEVNNLVLVVRNERGCSLQTAVTEAREMIETEARRFNEHAELLTATTDDDRTAYCDGLEQLMSGNLRWSQEASRYGHSQ